MFIEVLKSKIHRAVVTETRLDYEGSISVDPELYRAAGMFPHEKVDVFNLNNGARFTTYLIDGRPGEICINGAAARLAQPGDLVIIVSYAHLTPEEASSWQPTVVLVDDRNTVKEVLKPGS
ncbi:aspartate 1-decarboxylase [Spirochaeta thermophila]|uniref:Aspartate 1-decarboxylase n=1 Tax=Winmispira thermophila (strain ATCC 49972 / DSM 6192 / RI 19.B1) TaxID=665571 RepID=E0RNR5_WINT6|nr:aspartate 1-decarboxylase [Spirochaeta thermophila]ADN01188.1 putative aspartate 1-decarboxylase [Spirochaeta thermophila DSM 6192]